MQSYKNIAIPEHQFADNREFLYIVGQFIGIRKRYEE